MRFLVTLIAVFFSVAALAQEPFKLAVLGDSLASGYRLSVDESFYHQLQNALQDEGFDITVLNDSKVGGTSQYGKDQLNSLLLQNPNAVILELGINDALQGWSIDITQQNLQDIISQLKFNKIPVMLVGMEAPLTQPATYRKDFRDMYLKLADENDLILYPFFMKGLWHETNPLLSNPAYFLGDTVHPSRFGVELMVQNITPTVVEFLTPVYQAWEKR